MVEKCVLDFQYVQICWKKLKIVTYGTSQFCFNEKIDRFGKSELLGTVVSFFNETEGNSVALVVLENYIVKSIDTTCYLFAKRSLYKSCSGNQHT